MIKAAIDIGTNSTRLLVADTGLNSYKTLARKAKVTRLGQGVNETGRIDPEAIDRTVKTLMIYKGIIDSYGPSVPINIASTSAARDADNVNDFVQTAKKETGLKINVISAEEEATNAFLGATYHLESDKNYLVMDIGGGSTELICGRNKKVTEFYSKNIGCVRLFEMFVKNNPPTKDEINKIRTHIIKIYLEAIESLMKHAPFKLIGTAGTVTSLSAISQGLKVYDVEKVHHSVLTTEKTKEISEKLINMTVEERSKIPTMEPGREDVIVAGTIIFVTLVEMLGKEEVLVSETDILDGLLLSG